MTEKIRNLRAGLALGALALLAGCAGMTSTPAAPAVSAASPARSAPASGLPPVSGLACLPDGSFLAVTDVKNDPSRPAPFPPVLRLRAGEKRLTWEPVAVPWPDPDGAPSDLESVAAVPGTDSFLIVESGFFQGRFGRIFRISSGGDLLGFTTLTKPVENIEGTAVARVGDRLIFLDAERGENAAATAIRWYDLTLDPLRLGEPRSVELRLPEPAGPKHRHVSDLAVDAAGRLFTVSDVDPGDLGPFRSIVWEIGRVGEGGVTLLPTPRRVATVDGFKVEALAACQGADGKTRLFLGADDEDYGGAIRPLPDGL